MDWLLTTKDGLLVSAVMLGLAFMLMVDLVAEAVKARKGGDGNSEEKPSPPNGTDWRV